MGTLYDYLYKAYPAFKETKGMVDEVLWNVADKAEMAGEARGKEIGKEIKAKEIAQNLIQEGLTREQIARTTGLDLMTVETLMGTAYA